MCQSNSNTIILRSLDIQPTNEPVETQQLINVLCPVIRSEIFTLSPEADRFFVQSTPINLPSVYLDQPKSSKNKFNKLSSSCMELLMPFAVIQASKCPPALGASMWSHATVAQLVIS